MKIEVIYTDPAFLDLPEMKVSCSSENLSEGTEVLRFLVQSMILAGFHPRTVRDVTCTLAEEYDEE